MCVSDVCLLCVAVHSWERGTNSLFAVGLSDARGCRRGRGGEKQVLEGAEAAGQELWGFPPGSPQTLSSCRLGWTWALICVGPASQLQWPSYSSVSSLLLGEKAPIWKDEREKEMEKESAIEKVEKEKRDKGSQGCWRKGQLRGLPTYLFQLPQSPGPWGPD